MADVVLQSHGVNMSSKFIEDFKRGMSKYPPLFKKFVQKHLDNWDKNYATEEERSIANKFNEDTSSLAPIAS